MYNCTGNDTDLLTILINLDDANDRPRFQQSTYNATVSENRGSGVPVVTVTATDIDQQAGNRIFTYALQADYNKFSIDNANGKIITTGKFIHNIMRAKLILFLMHVTFFLIFFFFYVFYLYLKQKDILVFYLSLRI